jgi:hypothetical protein
MEVKMKNNLISLLIGITVTAFVAIYINSCNSAIKETQTITNTIDSTVLESKTGRIDTVYQDRIITKIVPKVVYRDRLPSDSSYVYNYKDSVIDLNIDAVGRLASIDVCYTATVKDRIIRIDSLIERTITINKETIVSFEQKQKLFYGGISASYNTKVDIGPSIMLNTKPIKVAYTFNIISKSHQATAYIPLF